MLTVSTDEGPRMIKADRPQRAVTYDTRTGPALTTSSALCYVWPTQDDAEALRRAYEVAVGVSLTVQPAALWSPAC